MCFNPTTLNRIYHFDKNTLPTQKNIEEEREFYDLYEEKDWVRIKNKTRQLRLDETESDYALRQRMMNYGANDMNDASSSSGFSSEQDRTPSPEPELQQFQRRMFRGRNRANARDTVSLFNIQFD